MGEENRFDTIGNNFGNNIVNVVTERDGSVVIKSDGILCLGYKGNEGGIKNIVDLAQGVALLYN